MYKYLIELQEAHLDLMEEYLSLLKKVSYLKPFIHTSSIIQHGERKHTKYKFLIKIYDALIVSPLKGILKFFTWKIIVKYFIEDHIKSKIIELSKIYMQELQRLNPNESKDKLKIEWLNEVIKSCEVFSSTLFSWGRLQKTIFWSLNIIATLIIAYYGKEFLIDVLRQSINNPLYFLVAIIFTIVILSIYGFFINIVIIMSFGAKRILFTPNIETEYFSEPKDTRIINIYKTEDNLFNLLGHNKTPEFPIDIAIPFLFYNLFPMLLILLPIILILKQVNANLIEIVISLFISSLPFLLTSPSYINDWKKREWK